MLYILSGIHGDDQRSISLGCDTGIEFYECDRGRIRRLKMERELFIEKVKRGLDQLKNGEFVSHEEVKKIFLLKKIQYAQEKSNAGKTYSTEEAKLILSKRIIK